MYERFCSGRKWKIELMDVSPSDAGGYKEIQFKVKGDKVYSVMKFESGVHRVQRVPKTESQGRIHTSTATVAVLPEADEVEVDINENDLRIDVYRAGGPGGQCVNTTDSAVRTTHRETGIVVVSRESRSQYRNRQLCLSKLRDEFAHRAVPPKVRHKTKPSRGQRMRRLADKRHRSQVKQLRGRVSGE